MQNRNGMQGNFFNSIVDLHKTTKYQVKGWEKCSNACLPERGLRDGCSTSPCLFNIYYRVVMRIAEKERKGICDARRELNGYRGPRLQIIKKEKSNREATEIKITLSLFPDDSIIVGENRKLEEGRIVKDVIEVCKKRRQKKKGPFWNI